jgi:hypothetical protein
LNGSIALAPTGRPALVELRTSPTGRPISRNPASKRPRRPVPFPRRRVWRSRRRADARGMCPFQGLPCVVYATRSFSPKEREMVDPHVTYLGPAHPDPSQRGGGR